MSTLNRGFIILSGEKSWFQSGDVDHTGSPSANKTKSQGKKTAGKPRTVIKPPPEILYPIFVKAAELADDPFWKTILRQAAVGKYQRGFQFRSGMLTYKVRTKLYTCNVNMEDPLEAATQVRNFMRDTAGILSEADVAQKNQELKERMTEMAEVELDSWVQVRTASHRSILISRFIENVAEILELTNAECGTLENLIRLGILVGYFNSTTIHVENGSIASIDGLIRCDDGTFSIDVNTLPSKPKKGCKGRRGYEEEMTTESQTTMSGASRDAGSDPDSQTANVNFLKLWIRFLSNIEKRSSRYVSSTSASSGKQDSPSGPETA